MVPRPILVLLNKWDLCDEDGDGNTNYEQYGYSVQDVLIQDVPNDQGGYVKLTVQRSYSDNGTVDSLYQIYRKFEDVDWVYVGSFPGTGESSYFFISPTIEDSIPGNPNYHDFKVYYRSYMDSSAFSNFPEYGYSIDNKVVGWSIFCFVNFLYSTILVYFSLPA